MEVVACLLLPLSRRGPDAPDPSDRARFALGREPHRRELPARQLLLHRVERPAGEGHAGVERAARLRGHPRGVPVREGPERRLAQARTAAPALRPAEQEHESVIGRAGRLSGVLVAFMAATAAPDPGHAQARLTREQVLAALERATPQEPADFTGQDLAELNLSGVDFKPGNQSMGIMRVDASGVDFSGADFTGANLRKALLVRADLTGADLTDADVTGADLTGAILKGIRGRDRIRGLDKALHVDQAIFND